MKKFILVLLLLSACAPVSEKVFVANEEGGSISVIDVVSLKEIDRVKLTYTHDGAPVEYMPHNVQVVGDLVLVTANVAHDEHEDEHSASEMNHDMSAPVPRVYFGVLAVEAHGEETSEDNDHPDQLVFIDAKSHKILDRVDLDVEAHLAHVVSDGKKAYVTSTDKDGLYTVNLDNKLSSFISLPEAAMPHGIRLTDNNNTAIIAGMGNMLILMDLPSRSVKTVALPGKGVQAGVAGNVAFVSVFDTKQLAFYDMNSDELSFVDLPGAKGPIQVYPSRDKEFVYVADQGVYFGQPDGMNTYKVSVAEKYVSAVIETGFAPHGVVVSPDGRVWVTNLNGNSVSLIENDKKVAEISVGVAPNGISYWSAK